MTRKKITQALGALVLTVSVVSASVFLDPNTRMEKLSELFSRYGADTFNALNFGIGGTGTADGEKKTLQVTDIATVVNSQGDDNAFIFCVREGIWAVYPIEPMKIGKNAMTATDANGRPFVMTMIKALRDAPDGKAHHIRYDVLTPDGRIQPREATVWKSSALLKRKNDTGKKFFCGTSIKAYS